MIEHWYITVAAVHDFQRVCGLPIADDGELFDGPAKRLDMLCREGAKYKSTTRDGTEIWQAKTPISGKMWRLELYVRRQERAEGHAPQLVRVRSKGSSGGKERRR